MVLASGAYSWMLKLPLPSVSYLAIRVPTVSVPKPSGSANSSLTMTGELGPQTRARMVRTGHTRRPV